jgi:hypothetical protein
MNEMFLANTAQSHVLAKDIALKIAASKQDFGPESDHPWHMFIPPSGQAAVEYG